MLYHVVPLRSKSVVERCRYREWFHCVRRGYRVFILVAAIRCGSLCKLMRVEASWCKLSWGLTGSAWGDWANYSDSWLSLADIDNIFWIVCVRSMFTDAMRCAYDILFICECAWICIRIIRYMYCILYQTIYVMFSETWDNSETMGKWVRTCYILGGVSCLVSGLHTWPHYQWDILGRVGILISPRFASLIRNPYVCRSLDYLPFFIPCCLSASS